MNEVIRQLIERKSVRAFKDQPIGEAEQELILRAAVNAPSAGDQQLYTIIRIQDPGTKGRLAEYCDHQPFIAKAPLALVFLADCEKWLVAYREAGISARGPEEGDLFIALDDALIAAQNSVTAAWSLGIGSCYIGDIMEQYEDIKQLLGLGELVFPAALVVFGYPAQGALAHPKPPRADQGLIVREERYRPLDRREARQMVSGFLKGKSYEEWVRAFYARKYASAFCGEMTRTVRAYLEKYRGAQ